MLIAVLFLAWGVVPTVCPTRDVGTFPLEAIGAFRPHIWERVDLRCDGYSPNSTGIRL